MQPGFDIDKLRQEAHTRWLKPAEVLFILQNYEKYHLTPVPPNKPPNGSLFLFNKRVLRFFRKDGHMWRKKKDGRAVGEAHERLKVMNVEALNCYYAHGEQNPYFQRRIYWMLDPAYEHIVLVHYREVSEGRYIAGSVSNLSTDSSSTINQSTSFDNIGKQVFTPGISELCEPNQSSCSPESVEVSSKFFVDNDKMDNLHMKDGSGNSGCSSQPEVNQALRKLAVQLSLEDDDDNVDSVFIDEKLPSYSSHDNSHDSGLSNYKGGDITQDALEDHSNGLEYREHRHYFSGDAAKQDYSSGGLLLNSSAGYIRDSGNISLRSYEPPEKLGWQELDYGGNNAEKRTNDYQISECNLRSLSAAREFLLGSDNSIESPASALLQEVVEPLPTGTSAGEANSGLGMFKKENSIDWIGTMHLPVDINAYSPDYTGMCFDQNQFVTYLGTGSSLTVAQKQRFSIREISPEWAFSSESTKVIITGDFLCNPSECTWAIMFGDIEVPLEIIQEGVLLCQAPQHVAGKVTLCITSGNREACSEVREFEYCAKPETSSSRSNLPQPDAKKNTEELLLLTRFIQILLCGYNGASVRKEDNVESEIGPLGKLNRYNQWGQIIEALTVGCENPSGTIEWLLLELLKDKLQQWLSSKHQENKIRECSLSKQEQGIIHMVSGLGYEWALNPILNSGVGVNFRDPNGWTALHWAARFGREKIVAALLAAGASAGAVTDPTSQDPVGKTPASIAADSGHKGLAGYLSEAALTGHLSSLIMEESEISKGSATVEAERAVESISERSIQIEAGATEDQLSLKDSLAAVRNAAQAAARIQSAFRAHSFRKRQQKDAASHDEYGMSPGDIHGLSAASKVKRPPHGPYDQNLHSAALCIQRKYRGWKGRKKFLTLRQHVVKIQAHVRGHQVRKKYKEFLWTVGVLEKVILRWRRRGAGLRGFRAESEPINEIEEDDILKVFRKQKVDAALDEAVSRVLSMVESPEARQQYRRMLESYRLAKAKLDSAGEAPSSFQDKYENIENIDEDMDPLTLEDIWERIGSPTVGFT